MKRLQTLHVLFELGDHLGSTSVVLDKATGELVERSTYQAYGGSESDYRPDRWNNFREDYRFTGKEEDVEVGLIYFGFRFLNPLLNRWVSADPLAVHGLGADPNMYAYVSGQSLKAIDPLGLCSSAQPCPNSGADGVGNVPSAESDGGQVTVLDTVYVVGDLPPPHSGGEEGAGNATEPYSYRQHGSYPSRQELAEDLAWTALCYVARGACDDLMTLRYAGEVEREIEVENQGRIDAGLPPMSDEEVWAARISAFNPIPKFTPAPTVKAPPPDGGFTADLRKTKAKTRGGQRDAANKQLNDRMKADPKFRREMEQRHGSDVFDRTSKLQRPGNKTKTRVNPKNTEWDHNNDDPYALDLRTIPNHREKTKREGDYKGGGFARHWKGATNNNPYAPPREN